MMQMPQVTIVDLPRNVRAKVEIPLGLLKLNGSAAPYQLRQAYSEGAATQYYEDDGWRATATPEWYQGTVYRVDPDWKPKVAPDTDLEEQRAALAESIAHWGRMIDWAEKQDPKDNASEFAMKDAIGETWFASDCALCRLCNGKVGLYKKCDICILARKLGRCSNRDDLRASWYRVFASGRWGTWVTNARRFQAAMIDVLAKSYEK